MTETANATAPVPSAVAVRPAGGMQVQTMDDLARMAKVVSDSRMFRGVDTPQKAAVRMLFAMTMGFDPIAGLAGVDLIDGTPTPNAHFWAAAIESHPRYDYRVVETTDQRCVIEFLRDGELRGRTTWTMDDARTALLADKDNWKKYPRAMLFSRAMTEGGRMFCPQLFGGVRSYAPEELDEGPSVTARAGKPEPTPDAVTPPEPETVVEAEFEEVPEGASDAEEGAAPEGEPAAGPREEPEHPPEQGDAPSQLQVAQDAWETIMRAATSAGLTDAEVQNILTRLDVVGPLDLLDEGKQEALLTELDRSFRARGT